MWGLVVGALIAAAPPVRLAVLPFDNDTNQPEFEVLRRGMADLLISDLTAVESLELVERMRLDDVRNELKLQSTKEFDPASRVKLGKILGASHAVFGSLIATAPKVNLVVRIIELKKGTVVTTVRVIGSPDDVFSLEESLVQQLIAALRLTLLGGPRSGHASIPALASWASGIELESKGQLAEAQAKLAEAVRLAPDFELAKERYAEILKRVKEAQKKRGSTLDERAKTLREHLTAQLGKAPLGRSLAARMGLANLALLELQRVVDAKAEKTQWVELAKRTEVERLEREWVHHAGALVTELKAARGKEYVVALDDADVALSKQTFDLDVSVWDFVTPTAVAIDLGNFLGSGWTPYRSDVPEFAIRPSAAQRTAKGLTEARAWFDVAQKEIVHESTDARPGLASRLANDRAEMLVLVGRREEAVAQWQGFLDAHPTSDDFPVFTKKLEAVMLLDDIAERDEKRIKSCDKALLDGLTELSTRTWRAKGVTGLETLSLTLRACAKRNKAFERAAFEGPAAELQRAGACDAYETMRARAASSGVQLELCK